MRNRGLDGMDNLDKDLRIIGAERDFATQNRENDGVRPKLESQAQKVSSSANPRSSEGSESTGNMATFSENAVSHGNENAL